MWKISQKARDHLVSAAADAPLDVVSKLCELVKVSDAARRVSKNKVRIVFSMINRHGNDQSNIQNAACSRAVFEFENKLQIVAPSTSANADDAQHTPTAEWRALTLRLQQQVDNRDYKRLVASVDA